VKIKSKKQLVAKLYAKALSDDINIITRAKISLSNKVKVNIVLEKMNAAK